jgi:hypothetical protein
MNRRSFLALLAASLTLDPEKALWLPGKKLVSIPKPPTLSPRYLTSDMILDAVLEHFSTESVIMQLVNERYDPKSKRWKKRQIGDSLHIRLPHSFSNASPTTR